MGEVHLLLLRAGRLKRRTGGGTNKSLPGGEIPDTFCKYLVREIVGENIVIYNHGELRVILDLNIKQYDAGTSLVVHWLRLHAPNAGGMGSIPGQRT